MALRRRPRVHHHRDLRRNEPDALLRQHLQRRRRREAAVLDRPDARDDSPADGLIPVRVNENMLSDIPRRRDRRAHFLLRIRHILGPVARRHEAAASGDLDPLRAVADLVVDRAPHAVHPFDDRYLFERHAVPDQTGGIEVPPDGGNHVPACHNARPPDDSRIDGFFQLGDDPEGEAEIPRVANGRKPVVQELTAGIHPVQRQRGVVAAHRVREEPRASGEMDVRIDEPRHHELRGQIDHARALRPRDALPDFSDPTVDDENLGGPERPVRNPVPVIPRQYDRRRLRRSRRAGGKQKHPKHQQ